MKKSKFICVEFQLPYIIQPKGTYDFTYRNGTYTITIGHGILPQLMQILTGTIGGVGTMKITDKLSVSGKKGGISVHGPREIFIGLSNVKIEFPSSSDESMPEFSYEKEQELRRTIVGVLNEYQYHYLNHSKKYWWHSISYDHFINMRITTEKRFASSMSWHHDKDLLRFKEDDEIREELIKDLVTGEKILPEDIFLIDARKHFLTSEYHLMYVELGIAFESLVSRCHQKIYSYEKRMFQEGKLIGQLVYLLSHYCKWDDDKISEVDQIYQNRNNVIHTNKRYFPVEDAIKHITIGEEVIEALRDQLKVLSKA